MDWKRLQAAVYLASIQEISPRPVGNAQHAVLACESTFQLCDRGDDGRAVLWNLDEVKSSQGRDARGAAFRLGAAPSVKELKPEAARREVHLAVLKGDLPRAERAVLALARAGGRGQVLEELWPYALREFFGLCHRTIFAAHTDRVIARVPEVLEPSVRVLVSGLMHYQPHGDLREYANTLEASARLRPGWKQGTRDSAESWQLAQRLRAGNAHETRDKVLEASDRGMGADGLWDALTLAAADLFVRTPELLGVHATTVTNACAHISRAARRDSTQRAALMTAAAWLPYFRGRFIQDRGVTMDEPGLTPLVEGEGPDFDLHAHLFVAVEEVHEVKYAAAVLEDADRVHPRFASALRAAARGYVCGPSAPPNTLGQQMLEFLEGR